MRLDDREESRNVEDRRGQRVGGGGFRPGKGSGGILMLIVVLVAGYYGLDLSPLLSGGSFIATPQATVQSSRVSSPEEEEMRRFTSVVLKTTEDAWSQIFRRMGRTYTPPRLVLYTEQTETGCGYGQSAMGPFYCPADQTVYLDMAFYRDLRTNLGGGGDFAQGYVLAHEVGHHVQHLLGIDEDIRRKQAGVSKAEANRYSVQLELQADCFAGVWGNAMQREGILDPGDLEEALRTAQAIGDDRLQRQATGQVMPDSFTHGTSRQRHAWFSCGFDSGDPGACGSCGDGE